MMRHRILLISSLFLLAGKSTSLAGDRTEREMLAIAQTQLKAEGALTRSALDIVKLADERQYAVFGNDAQGFVIVSRSTDCAPVIGYSNSPYHADDLPCGLKWWLETVSDNIERGTVSQPVARTRASYTQVEPFIATQWGQGDPYNFLTPELNGKHTPTGCVATAMAQVMKYYNYPAQGQGMGYYTLENNPTRVTEKIQGVYEWNKMRDTYKGPNELSDAEKLPVATLMKDAGLATNMTYGSGGSGASEIVAAHGLAYNFRFDSLALKAYERDFFDQNEWMEDVYSRLMARTPILYVGQAASGGHAFILDGIDKDGLVHVNWGWNGEHDGFYNIDLLNPGTDAYASSQGMVYDFKCQETPDPNEAYYSLWYAMEQPYEFTLNGKILSVSHQGMYNFHFLYFVGDIVVYAQPREGDPAAGYATRFSSSTAIYPTYRGKGPSKDMIFLTGIPAGDYLLYLASKSTIEEGYQPVRCPGGPICYELHVAEDGSLTMGDKPKLLSEYKSATGINGVTVRDQQPTDAVYDLNGRQVGTDVRTLRKGIYIQNGHKVIR